MLVDWGLTLSLSDLTISTMCKWLMVWLFVVAGLVGCVGEAQDAPSLEPMGGVPGVGGAGGESDGEAVDHEPPETLGSGGVPDSRNWRELGDGGAYWGPWECRFVTPSQRQCTRRPAEESRETE